MELLESPLRTFPGAPGPDSTDAASFAAFCEAERAWLLDYAFFRALMEENRTSETWDQWREEHRDADSARDWIERATGEVRRGFPNANHFSHTCNGSHSTNGWRRNPMRKSAASRLMGDIPFGVNFYSADVYSRRDEFALDWSGVRRPSRISRTTSSPKSGGKTGESRFTGGT